MSAESEELVRTVAEMLADWEETGELAEDFAERLIAFIEHSLGRVR